MKIIYTNNEGGVSVIYPTGELSIEEVAAKDVPEGVAYEIVEDDAIPSDRTFRNAWVMGDCCVEHDLDKCKAIHRDTIRQVRTELFAVADIAYMKALETNNDIAKDQAAAVKGLLRDAPAAPEIDAATTPEELKAAWNESLLGPNPYGGTN